MKSVTTSTRTLRLAATASLWGYWRRAFNSFRKFEQRMPGHAPRSSRGRYSSIVARLGHFSR
jgi:hypothetical protein